MLSQSLGDILFLTTSPRFTENTHTLQMLIFLLPKSNGKSFQKLGFLYFCIRKFFAGLGGGEMKGGLFQGDFTMKRSDLIETFDTSLLKNQKFCRQHYFWNLLIIKEAQASAAFQIETIVEGITTKE